MLLEKTWDTYMYSDVKTSCELGNLSKTLKNFFTLITPIFFNL